MLVLASIANLFPQPSLVEPENRSQKKTGLSFAFASAVAISLRSNDFIEGCG
jgi:triphosphoribosyl-dephospho-CoA synthetase